MTTNYLDLDKLAAATPKKALKLKGQSYEFQPISVEDFIANTQLVESLGLNPSAAKEFEALISMLTRSFPTCPEAEFRKLPITHLQAIMDFAKAEDAPPAETAGEKTEANPQ